MDLWTYLQQQLQFGHGEWTNFKARYQSDHPIVNIPSQYMRDDIPITYQSYTTLREQCSTKRFAFTTPPQSLSATHHHHFITVIASITGLSQVAPYPHHVIIRCNKCYQTIDIPIENPLSSEEVTRKQQQPCGTTLCALSKPERDITFQYCDCTRVIFQTEEKNIIGYVRSDPIAGFPEVTRKLRHALEMSLPIYAHGFVQIGILDGEYRYYFEIIDVDLVTVTGRPTRLLPFYMPTLPATEKEMILTIFFTNLTFMQRYLDFTSYQIHKGYPDLIIHNGNNVRNIEFEFDVANFYQHGHDKRTDVHCDLIIAWKCTTKRNDVPYLLLQTFTDQYIPDHLTVPSNRSPDEMLTDIHEVIGGCLPMYHIESIIPIMFPLIAIRRVDSFFATRTIIFHCQNVTDDDRPAWDAFLKMFPIRQYYFSILLDLPKKIPPNAITIPILCQPLNQSIVMPYTKIKPLQTYINTVALISQHMAPLFPNGDAYQRARSYVSNIEKMDVLILFAGIWAGICQASAITDQHIDTVWKIIGKMAYW